MTQRIRVLVVDDSVVVRRLVSDLLNSEPDIEVIATAPDGKIALEKAERCAPDLITMDIEMPVMDGIEAVRRLRESGSRVPIIMFSTLTERGAVATIDALAAGASDYVAKPTSMSGLVAATEQVRSEIVPKIRALARPQAPAAAAPSALNNQATAGVPTRPTKPAAVVLGCSTGGPDALSQLLQAIDGPLAVPMLIVQHMPPMFTTQLAARLDRLYAPRVVEATDGEPLLPGSIYIAPGDFHLEMAQSAGQLVAKVEQGPPENFCRPAVDVLFRSAANVLGAAVLGVVLTGMGTDGVRGSRDIVDAGGSVWIQDAESSVVWGMPGAVAAAQLASAELPLEQLGRRLGAFRAVSAL